jgi:hypothetical protein
MATPNRYYSSTAIDTSLVYGISNSDTQVVLATTAGYPTSYPFTLAIGFDTSSEELVDITGVGSLTNSYTITRGVDSTAAVAHSAGSVVKHVVTARDLREAQAHIAATTSVHGITDTSALITSTSTSTLTNKTLTSPALTSPAISGGSITGTVTGNPTFTGTVTLPSTTSIGPVTATEISYVDGVTSAIQTQLTAGTTALTTHAALTTSAHGIADTSKLAKIASASAGRTIFVQSATPTALATGDIWFQVTGL